MEMNDKILEVLRNTGQPMKAQEISEASGVDKKEVDKAIKKMQAADLIESPKRCFYQPKK